MTKNKEITIYDIANRVGVSSATVSRALKNHSAINEKTKKRVLDVAKELGYQVNTFASNLRNNRSNTIGLIVPRLNSMFMSDVIAGIEEVVNNAEYNLIISQSLESYDKEKFNAETMFNNRVDGLLISLAYDTIKTDHFTSFIKKGIPLIFFDRVPDINKCPTIVIDNFKAAYDVTSHLINRGAKNILHITGNLAQNVYSDRLKGYKQALLDNSITFDTTNLIVTDLSTNAGTQLARDIMNMPKKPDAVFASSDSCAVSCMLQLKKDGIKIPDDILFAGFNNDFISSMIEPNLTTVDYKGYEMGIITAQTLINQLNKNLNFGIAQSIVIRHELIIRDSSGKQ